ncbi:MAG: hypothetical protein PHN68_06125, partial [Prolixibacteraceae bacterium]|nr:hypothetical protein [Prolixibacteraceae bacterium]
NNRHINLQFFPSSCNRAPVSGAVLALIGKDSHINQQAAFLLFLFAKTLFSVLRFQLALSPDVFSKF